MLSGLSTVNIELTSRCNKNCGMCGRRKLPSTFPFGDIDFDLLGTIANQLPSNITVQLHNNGEPLLYPKLKEAISLFRMQYTGLNTNGILLVEKADEIINNLDTLTISIIENNDKEQIKSIGKFLELKGDKKPLVVFRCLGNIDTEPYKDLGMVATRVLHSPKGSFQYKRKVTVPETGVCLDLLHHLSIDCYGNISKCVRFDPNGDNIIGNLHVDTLDSIWNGQRRQRTIRYHLKGRRDSVPICSTCEFWGIPIGV